MELLKEPEGPAVLLLRLGEYIFLRREQWSLMSLNSIPPVCMLLAVNGSDITVFNDGRLRCISSFRLYWINLFRIPDRDVIITCYELGGDS